MHWLRVFGVFLSFLFFSYYVHILAFTCVVSRDVHTQFTHRFALCLCVDDRKRRVRWVHSYLDDLRQHSWRRQRHTINTSNTSLLEGQTNFVCGDLPVTVLCVFATDWTCTDDVRVQVNTTTKLSDCFYIWCWCWTKTKLKKHNLHVIWNVILSGIKTIRQVFKFCAIS